MKQPLELFKQSIIGRLAGLLIIIPPLGIGLIVFCDLILALLFDIRLTVLSAILQGLLLGLGIPLVIGFLLSRSVARPARVLAQSLHNLTNTNQASVKVGVRELNEISGEVSGLRQRLHQEEMSRKDLISDISHELNTPLSVLHAQITALRDGVVPLIPARLGILSAQTEQLMHLVKQLNAYAQACTPQKVSQTINLQQVCQHMCDGFEDDLRKHDMYIQLNVPRDINIIANRHAVDRILTNLILNTLHYAKKGEVIIAADDYALRFSDCGPGVESNHLSMLFDRFYRVDTTNNNRTVDGMGLGLAIVKELVQQQGWSIRAESNSPGLRLVITFSADSL